MCQGKLREFGTFAKTRELPGILFAQVVNSLILKVKDITIFAVKIPSLFRSWIYLPSQFCICRLILTNHKNSHKEKFAIGKVKTGKIQGMWKCDLSGDPA